MLSWQYSYLLAITVFVTFCIPGLHTAHSADRRGGEGACCFLDGDICLEGIDGQDCIAIEGRYLGDGLTCDGDEDQDGVAGCDDLCPDTPQGQPVDAFGCSLSGACCFEVGVCLENIDDEICLAINGSYRGNGSSCDDGCSSPTGDLNADGKVDLIDFVFFHDCVTGPAGRPVSEECIPADFDEDSDVDLIDFATLQILLSSRTLGEPLVVSLSVSGIPEEGYVAPGATVDLTVVASGGVSPYTYDFNVVTQPTGSAIDVVLGTGGAATITPVVEGLYEVEAVVTDSAVPHNTATSAKVRILVSSLVTTGILINVNGNTGVADTCAVGLPDPTFNPQGADDGSTITDRALEVSTVATGGSGNFTYAWSTLEDVGTFTSGEDESLAMWDVPVVDEVSTVTFQVIVTDEDSGIELTEQQTLTLSPAPQISGICLNTDTEPCLPAPQTVSLGDLTDGVLPISLYVTDETIITDLVLTITEDTSNPAGAEVSLCLTSVNYLTEPHPCAITFTDPGTYTFRIRLRDDTCVESQSADGPKQRVDTEFTVIIDP